MPTNFKNKIRSADIIYEIYPSSIIKFLPIFIIIYSVKFSNILVSKWVL